jgi:hypothetical protein
MSKTAIWAIGGALAVIFLALAIFYFIQGPYHPFTFSGTPTDRHPTHAIVFFVLAVISLIGARFAANSSNTAK